MEASYLERIRLHLTSGDPDDRVLKTYFDSWYAHSRGGAMLEPSGRPKWMNRGDLEGNPALCYEAHAISHAAEAELDTGRCANFVREHTIPKSQLIAEMKRRNFGSNEEVGAFVRLWFTITILTQDEHRMIGHQAIPALSDTLLRTDKQARFKRYTDAGISYRLLAAALESWP
jgi:hypothetical protein